MDPFVLFVSWDIMYPMSIKVPTFWGQWRWQTSFIMPRYQSKCDPWCIKLFLPCLKKTHCGTNSKDEPTTTTHPLLRVSSCLFAFRTINSTELKAIIELNDGARINLCRHDLLILGRCPGPHMCAQSNAWLSNAARDPLHWFKWWVLTE